MDSAGALPSLFIAVRFNLLSNSESVLKFSFRWCFQVCQNGNKSASATRRVHEQRLKFVVLCCVCQDIKAGTWIWKHRGPEDPPGTDILLTHEQVMALPEKVRDEFSKRSCLLCWGVCVCALLFLCVRERG